MTLRRKIAETWLVCICMAAIVFSVGLHAAAPGAYAEEMAATER